MKIINLRPVLLISLVTSLTLPAFGADQNRCEAWLKVKLGFVASDTGKLTLQVAQSKHKAVEATLNGIAQLMLGRALKLDELSVVTKKLIEDKSEDPYFVKLARAFDLTIKVDEKTQFAKMIPETGPVLVLMNHPANGRETIALAAAISLIRPDTKVAMTFLLKDYPQMADNAIFLNPTPSPEATAYNKGQREQMDLWIKNGGVLLAHPSGEVSTYKNSENKDYQMDPAWRLGIAKLIENNPDVQILPAFIDTSTTETFQKVKAMKPPAIGEALSPVFHIREIAIGQNAVIPVNLGNSIKGQDALAKGNGNLKNMMQYLRARTYALKGRFEKTKDSRKLEPIAAPTDATLVKQDISRMKILTEEKGLQVLIAQGKDIPNVVRELGRLREVTFRTVGEASGKSLDVDNFDQHYYHVVMYKPDSNVIVGAYRIAFVDKVIQQIGLDGLYNRQLFEYKNLLNGELKHSIELGRAFVNAELTDRDRRSAIYFLPLIWKGIAKVLEQNPQYTHLMGPVSISNQYSDVSKAIMISFLTQKFDTKLRSEVLARNGFKPKSPVLREALSLVATISNVKELNSIITEIDGIGIPSLISSYERLGARYLGFNFDPDFNAVDGLIFVNLLTADRTELVKYFGAEGLQMYLNFHGLNH